MNPVSTSPLADDIVPPRLVVVVAVVFIVVLLFCYLLFHFLPLNNVIYTITLGKVHHSIFKNLCMLPVD